MTGIEAITQERLEQIEKHGRTIEDDVVYNPSGQLRWAARAIIDGDPLIPAGWNTEVFMKIINKPIKQRIVIAASLLAAEYDRLTFEENFPQEKLKL